MVVADDDDGDACARALLVAREAAPGAQRRAQRVEVVGRDHLDERLPHALARRHADHRKGMGHDLLEHVVAVPDVGIVGVGESAEGLGLGPIVTIEADQIVSPPRERPDQQGVDDREHGRIGADAESQHRGGDYRETGALAQRSRPEPQVLQSLGHSE